MNSSVREDARAALEAYDGGTLLDDWRTQADQADRVANALRALLGEPVPADEREALGFFIRDFYRANGMYAGDQPLADAILAAGFRRQGPITDTQVQSFVDALGRAVDPHGPYAADQGDSVLIDGFVSKRALTVALESAKDAS